MSGDSRRVGLVPAAGLGTRAGHPFSKELYPVRHTADAAGEPRAVSSLELLLDQFARAGATEAYVVIRDGKWDIPARLGTRGRGLDVAYLMADDSQGVPFTLDVASRFLTGCEVLVGFPDILLDPDDAFVPVVERLGSNGADVALGLFPPTHPEVNDQVRVDGNLRIVELAPKPVTTALDYAWAIAAWGPGFTRFLQARTRELARGGRVEAADGREYSLGHLLSDAIESGLRIQGALVEGGAFQDIGTPAGLEAARARGWIQ